MFLVIYITASGFCGWETVGEEGFLRKNDRTCATVATFDIFDTVITRRVGEPRSAFLLLGRRLCKQGLITCSAHVFATSRTAAEVRTFGNVGGLDSPVTLLDIYAELANALHWSPTQTAKIYEAELQLEAELLVPLPNGCALVAQARRSLQKVAFVSDMYLPSAYLETILRDLGIFEDGDVLIVSNEERASKATGKLWPIVIDRLDTAAERMHHAGNHPISDGRTARKAGLSTHVLDENNLNRYELALEAHCEATDGLTSALAGASRLARLDPPDPERRAVSDVSAGVVAPFVIGSLLWTLNVAKEEGLAELFFVARDGQLLRDVAEILAPKLGFTGKLTYLYGSRQAWSLAGLTETHADRLTAVVPDAGDIDATLRQVLNRLDIAPEEIALPLSRAGFHRATWGRPLAEGQAERLRDLLCDDPDLSLLVTHNAKRSRDLVLSYLEQVGAVTDQSIGFVDLGTGATLFNSLASILGSIGQEPPTGFYFGLRSKVPDVGFGRPRTYVRNEDEQIGFLRTPGLLTMVELACTADHGSVLGYKEENGIVVPDFDEGGNGPVVDWGLPIVCEIVRRVAEELVLTDDLVGNSGIDLRPAALDVFSLFWSSPTKEEARCWGSYPFEDGWGSESYRHPIAETRGVRDVARRQPYRHWWEEGASQLSGPVTRTAFESRRRAKTVASKVRSKLR